MQTAKEIYIKYMLREGATIEAINDNENHRAMLATIEAMEEYANQFREEKNSKKEDSKECDLCGSKKIGLANNKYICFGCGFEWAAEL